MLSIQVDLSGFHPEDGVSEIWEEYSHLKVSLILKFKDDYKQCSRGSVALRRSIVALPLLSIVFALILHMRISRATPT